MGARLDRERLNSSPTKCAVGAGSTVYLDLENRAAHITNLDRKSGSQIGSSGRS